MDEFRLAEGPQCRICFGGPHPPPAGLSDLLATPCSCRGTQAHVHLSCLHAWQLFSLHNQQDPGRCGVCRQPYHVPAVTWQAAVAAGTVNAAERRQVEDAQQAAAGGWFDSILTALATALAGGGGAVASAAATVGAVGGAAAAVAVMSAELVQLLLDPATPAYLRGIGAAAALPPHVVQQQSLLARVALSGGLTVCTLGMKLLFELFATQDWRQVRQGQTWQLLQQTALEGAHLAAALALQRLCAVDRFAPGAPAKQPPLEQVADLAVIAMLCRFASHVAPINILPRLLLLCLPGGRRQVHYVLQGWAAIVSGLLELSAFLKLDAVVVAFSERPAAVRALWSVLRPGVLRRALGWLQSQVPLASM